MVMMGPPLAPGPHVSWAALAEAVGEATWGDRGRVFASAGRPLPQV